MRNIFWWYASSPHPPPPTPYVVIYIQAPHTNHRNLATGWWSNLKLQPFCAVAKSYWYHGVSATHVTSANRNQERTWCIRAITYQLHAHSDPQCSQRKRVQWQQGIFNIRWWDVCRYANQKSTIQPMQHDTGQPNIHLRATRQPPSEPISNKYAPTEVVVVSTIPNNET